MEPLFIVRKSVCRAFTPLRILFIWLIIPLLVIIVRIIQLRCETIEFYSDKIIKRSGIFFKKEKRSAFTGVMGVSVSQGIMGRMFGYGDVHVDVAGKWDIRTNGVKNPHALQDFLEEFLINKNSTLVTTVMN